MNRNQTFHANYHLRPTLFALEVSTTGTGNGVVTSVPSGINCGSTCTAEFGFGTVVNLSANAAPGSAFAGWTGACSGVGACVITIGAPAEVPAAQVTARFTLITPP
jgi:hypothetical protein